MGDIIPIAGELDAGGLMSSRPEAAGVIEPLADWFAGRLPGRKADVALPCHPDGEFPARIVCPVEQTLLDVALDGEPVESEEPDDILVKDELGRVVLRFPVPVEEAERLVGKLWTDRLV